MWAKAHYPRGVPFVEDGSVSHPSERGYVELADHKDCFGSTVMSNCDHTIEPDAEKRLKSGKVYGRHAAWDFNALVWWEDGEFHSQVYRYHEPVGEYSAPTLQELMEKANENHGWD
jgi:hypothetical protein